MSSAAELSVDQRPNSCGTTALAACKAQSRAEKWQAMAQLSGLI